MDKEKDSVLFWGRSVGKRSELRKGVKSILISLNPGVITGTNLPPFLNIYSPAVQKLIYTTNMIESYNRQLRSPFEMGFNIIKIGNINLAIFIYKQNETGNIYIVDYFCELNKKNKFTADVEYKDEIIKGVSISPYVFLKKEDILIASNLNLDIIKDNITDIEYTHHYINFVILFVLELISAYDIAKGDRILNTAKYMCGWAIVNDSNNPIHKINLYQIIRRERLFANNEIKDLLALREQDKSDMRIMCAINIF